MLHLVARASETLGLDPTRSKLVNVFGTIGTVLWMIQLLPQIRLNWKRKTTHPLHPFLYLSWLWSGLVLGPYTIVQHINVPIIIQPHMYGSLCCVFFCQMLYYDRKWSRWACIATFGTYAVLGAGFELGMYYACEALEKQGKSGLTMTLGIVSAILLPAGFLPEFVEIFKTREVIGLSYLFLAMDSGGAVFSIISLALSANLDWIACAGYIAIFIVELAVLILAAWYNPRARRRRASMSEEGEKGEKGEKGGVANSSEADEGETRAGCVTDAERANAITKEPAAQ